ncbi:triose-phosphate isomerase [Colwellia sp. PAMC 21821]|uniref:triose-phosphate isomerase n=1 Tax=Colwellia sp. PAMC 21821 TaxID=1816219 RepID=UPI0009BF80FA|nr:triose-phosphate isomerase [Colwellia sp. PAMC 21821]ARD42956.1 triose-phosphate isomerase [Colwellia sp. PAMC 21821]
MNRLSIVAANWKMNGSLALVNSMVSELKNVTLNENVEVVVCPSFPYLAAFSLASANVNLSKAFNLGAQNLNEYANGAFTGEVSTSMLQEVGVSYVIVGHSERRSIYKESSVLVAHKVKAALSAGLKPILCIGESEDERVAEQTEVVLAAQLQPVIDEIGIENFKNVVIAYEPVWAIGTGKTASPEMAQATHQFIREFIAKVDENVAVKLPLLYGGSVNATNCEELFAQADIDGGLIGGASLKAEEFKIICSAAKGK